MSSNTYTQRYETHQIIKDITLRHEPDTVAGALANTTTAGQGTGGDVGDGGDGAAAAVTVGGEDRGDIIKFYNRVFIPVLKTFLLWLQKTNNSGGTHSGTHSGTHNGPNGNTQSGVGGGGQQEGAGGGTGTSGGDMASPAGPRGTSPNGYM